MTITASNKKLFLIGLCIAFSIAIIDQCSKAYIIELFDNIEPKIKVINRYFNVVSIWNQGISFGLFNGYNYSNIIFSTLSFFILCFLVLWLARNQKLHNTIALGMIIGGAIGNIIDRFRYKAVADFIQLHINNHYWPAFNVADAAICIGVTIIAIDSLALDIKGLFNKK
jgi:signal peptidase II